MVVCVHFLAVALAFRHKGALSLEGEQVSWYKAGQRGDSEPVVLYDTMCLLDGHNCSRCCSHEEWALSRGFRAWCQVQLGMECNGSRALVSDKLSREGNSKSPLRDTRAMCHAGCERSSYEKVSAFEHDDFREHLVSGGDDLAVCRETALCSDHPHELSSQVHV